MSVMINEFVRDADFHGMDFRGRDILGVDFVAGGDPLGGLFSQNKNTSHIDGCSCASCHDHDNDGKIFLPGDIVSDAEDVIAGDITTTSTLSPGSRATSEIDTADDSDWFRITLEAGETYQFSTYLASSGLRDSILTLRDENGNAIATNDDMATGLLQSEIIFTAATAGTYYLDVTSFGTATGQYFVSSSRPVDDDVAQGAGTQATLTLGADATVSTLDQTGDRDWYEVTLEAGVRYEFTTSSTGNAGDADTTLTLRDAQGNVVSYNDDSSGTYSRIRITPDETGTYYIDVGGWANSEDGAYQLTGVVAPPLQEFTNDPTPPQ